MRILFLGDVVGRAAREAVTRQVPVWRKQYELDFVCEWRERGRWFRHHA
jgi:calcineurin-like phosphoesterase